MASWISLEVREGGDAMDLTGGEGGDTVVVGERVGENAVVGKDTAPELGEGASGWGTDRMP